MGSPADQLRQISVVILPLPAQGHLNQLLHLACRLAVHGAVQVHYVGSTVHNRQVRDRAYGQEPAVTPNLHFHDFPLPSYSTPPPNPNSPIKFPSHLQPAFDAAIHLSSPLSSLLHSLSSSSRRVVLIHDSPMSFAAELASPLPNAESYVFHSVSAFTTLFFHLQSRQQPQPLDESELTFEDCFSDEFLEFLYAQYKMTGTAHGRILNTCREIEGTFVEKLQLEPSWKGQKVFALGPLNPITVDERRRHKCLDWLDQQPEKSVVYVSFGTTSSLSADQIAELGQGLESCGQRFIWVVRDADRGDIYATTGTGDGDDEEADLLSEGMGMVVWGWVPQLDILAHVATAGFVSHCGWNSCMESMSMGVPMLAWPMHSDQPRNAVLVTEVLRAGIIMRDWRRRNEVLVAAEIKEAILRVMVSDEGKEVARRAVEVGEVIQECGRRQEELDSFIAHITRG